MQQNITYFDLRMYVVPGALLGVSLYVVGKTLGFFAMNGEGIDVFDSVLFILVSYILGHLVQVYAHERPENKLKGKFWDGMFPTERVFFAWNKSSRSIVDESTRKTYVELCLQEGYLNKEEVSKCENIANLNPDLKEKIKTAARRLRYEVRKNPEYARQLESSLSMYQLHRGFFVAAFWGGVVSIFGAVISLLDALIANGVFSIIKPVYGLIVWGIICFILWYAFKWRCRGAADGFARLGINLSLALGK